MLACQEFDSQPIRLNVTRSRENWKIFILQDQDKYTVIYQMILDPLGWIPTLYIPFTWHLTIQHSSQIHRYVYVWTVHPLIWCVLKLYWTIYKLLDKFAHKVASSVGRRRPVAPPRPGFDSHVERISGLWGKKIPSLCSPQGLALSGMSRVRGFFRGREKPYCFHLMKNDGVLSVTFHNWRNRPNSEAHANW